MSKKLLEQFEEFSGSITSTTNVRKSELIAKFAKARNLSYSEERILTQQLYNISEKDSKMEISTEELSVLLEEASKRAAQHAVAALSAQNGKTQKVKGTTKVRNQKGEQELLKAIRESLSQFLVRYEVGAYFSTTFLKKEIFRHDSSLREMIIKYNQEFSPSTVQTSVVMTALHGISKDSIGRKVQIESTKGNNDAKVGKRRGIRIYVNN